MIQNVLESTLLAAGKQGDRDAIARLFERHYSGSLQRAAGILRNHDDAEDAVQSAFFQAYRCLESFRGDSSFKTWINRIVVNCCLLQLRETRHHVTWVDLEDHNGTQGPDVLPCNGPSPEKFAWAGEIAAAFSDAVATLPKQLREAYTMHAMSELSLQEIATSLGLTVSATKTRLFRARAGIRSSLQPFVSPHQ